MSVKIIFIVLITNFLIFFNNHNNVQALNQIQEKIKYFKFPESIDQSHQNRNEEKSEENNSEDEILTRQLISGRVSRQNAQQTTCTCVPPGQCPNKANTDGSGLIDIRIVNTFQPSTQNPPPQQCQYGLELCCLPGPYRCGIRYPPVPKSPIAGPGEAEYGAYPWQAALLTSEDVYLGSGALIDQRHILTAAHKINNLPLNSIRVRLGEWDASSENEPIPAQEYTISRVFIHPNFNANNLQNDIAILRLSNDVKLGETPTISTVCLPTSMFTGQKCYVAGWGKDDFGPNGRYQAIQRMVDVQIQTQQFCQNSLTKTRLGSSFIFNTTSFICAGGEPGKDACTGDGGSPLVCESNRQWYVIGLVAWGIGCATGGIPGVYVNVLSYIPWIRNTINA